MTGPAAPARAAVSFGPFTLVAGERLLTKDGAPVELGARTLDTLIALVSRPNEIVSKRELMALVWPDVTVEEGSLRFHVASLRTALGDGKDGARYIATLAGRGYCFVAPLSRASAAPKTIAAPAPVPNFLPARLMRMVGRSDGIQALMDALTAARFVTVVGTGGVGKTAIAVAVAHEVLESFDGAVLFFDLSMQSDPAMVPGALALMLGLSVQSDDPVPGLIAFLRDRRFLLILDNCEHVIEAAAVLATRIFVAAPEVHILATSREALRVEGEQVHRLTPLAFPPEEPGLTAEQAAGYSAVQLFLERAAANGARLDLNDADAAVVVDICRKLDGVALAIELAAGRVPAYGLQQTAALLDQRLSLLWQGQRTAPARQQTLQATIDWSYQLLSDLERLVFRRFGVFVGPFTLEAALTVATDPGIEAGQLFGAVDSLVAKSMVATRPVGAMIRYRLLAAARAYALEVSADEAERTGTATRHALYCRRWLEEAWAAWPNLSNATERAPYLGGLGNVRAALDWCFGAGGDAKLGIEIAAAAAPVFLAMSLLTECQRRSERALLALDDAARGGPQEMQLQAAVGLSTVFIHGSSDAAGTALNRSLDIAAEQKDPLTQLQLLGILHMFHGRIGDPKAALDDARRGMAIAGAIADPAAMALARALLGMSLHFIGDLATARAELEAALAHRSGLPRNVRIYLGFERQSLAGSALARTLWQQGHTAEALERAHRTVRDAAATDHPVTLSIALLWAVSVFLWNGDLDLAEQHIDWFHARAETYSLGPYLAVARGFRAELALSRGDAAGAVEGLRGALADLRSARHALLIPAFSIALAQGLAATGQSAEAIALIDETIGLIEANGDFSYMPELYRTQGRLQPDALDAEACFARSLDWSRRQAARAWELRTAVDLATLLIAQGRGQEAGDALQPVFAQFDGSDTADLRAAAGLLTTP